MSAGPTNRRSNIMNDTPFRTCHTSAPPPRCDASACHRAPGTASAQGRSVHFISFSFLFISFPPHFNFAKQRPRLCSDGLLQLLADLSSSRCLIGSRPHKPCLQSLQRPRLLCSAAPRVVLPCTNPLLRSMWFTPQTASPGALSSSPEPLRSLTQCQACSLWISACARSTCEAQRLLGRDARLEPLRPPGRKGRRGGASRAAQRAAKGFRCGGRAAKGFLEATVLAALATVEAPLLRPFATLELTWCFSSRSLALA